MPLLTLANVTHCYGTNIVLDGVTMSIDPREKVGLVGRNGCGKTTLLRIILGDLPPDSGAIQLAKNARVAYLSQDPEIDPEETLRGAAEVAFENLHRLHAELNRLFDRMADATGPALDGLLRRQADLEARIEAAGGYAIDHRIDATLHGLGFSDGQFSQQASALSGGEKGRLGLARLLLEAPDLLLLDEPTNHLDIDGREWLESFLAEEYGGAVLVVSHDRWLLDRVVDRIIEIERGAIRQYPGNYAKFVELRRERALTESRVYEKQRDHIRAEETFIARYKAGQRARQARGRQAKLDRFKRDQLVEKPTELDVMKLKLPRAERSGDLVIVAEGLTKRYDGRAIFDQVDLRLERGARVGVIGPNGAGKTTLVRCLLGEVEPDQGSVRRGSRVSIGYYRQLHDHLDLSLSVWQYVQSVLLAERPDHSAPEQRARDLAGAFLFSGDEQDKTLGELSGGERSRAVLAGLVGSGHNLLVLDEPTNHLDIPSAERLEQALTRDGGYEGTLLLITHDRALLETTCDRLLILDNSSAVTIFFGTYSEWKRGCDQEHRGRVPDAEAAPVKVESAKARRRAAAERRAAQPAVAPVAALNQTKLEQRIEEIESRISEIDRNMVDPEVYTDGEKCRALQRERAALVAELEPIEFEWSRRADEA